MAKKFENIFIASDLDGTYFNMKSQIVDRNVEKVKYFCENGGHFTVCTGRGSLSLINDLCGIELDIPLLVYNGMAFCDVKTGEISDETFMRDMSVKGELFRQLLPMLKSENEEERLLGARAFREGLAALENREEPVQYEDK